LLVNLILNAQQAIVRDGTIVVRTAWNAARNEVCLSVQDNGPGVAEEVGSNLFELFVSTKLGGGGVGLAIAKQIAEEHGGTISYETSPSGTTFNVVMPGS
jgi:signal transduction histidine kinase